METLPTLAKCNSGYYSEDFYDHQLHFSEVDNPIRGCNEPNRLANCSSSFLEVAKKHTSQAKLNSSEHPSTTINREEEGRKSKKSWKSSLFFWSKSKKNVDPHNESTHGTTGPNFPRLKRGVVSGPILRQGERVVPANRSGRPTSGPIASFFNSSRKEEVEIPYTSLEQINHPSTAKDFGPIYRVT